MALSFLSFCHLRRLSPTPVPDLIGDPVKKGIQSSKGSSVVVFGICSGAISWRFLSCLPDLIGDPVKKGIQSSKGSSVLWYSCSSSTPVPDACPRPDRGSSQKKGSSQVKDPVSLSLVFVAAPSHGAFFLLLLHPRRLSPTFPLLSSPTFPPLSSSTLVIEDPVSLLFLSHNQQPWIPAFAGMTD